jgi:SAM-dependent methyltransferase
MAGIRHKRKGHAMNHHENKPMNAHDSWADYYDCVYKLTHGEVYQRFTDQTLRVIRHLAAPPARVVDFGAGTGRLAIPLARAGYTVTAVETSAKMCRVLMAKAAAGVEGAVINHCASCWTNPIATAQQAGVKVALVNQTICRPVKKSAFDLGVCVFTVLNYLLDDLDLRQFACAAMRAIRADGKLLVSFVEDMRPMQQSLNGQHTDESWDRECSVVRNINVLQLEGTLYEYHEKSKLTKHGGGNFLTRTGFRFENGRVKKSLLSLRPEAFSLNPTSATSLGEQVRFIFCFGDALHEKCELTILSPVYRKTLSVS